MKKILTLLILLLSVLVLTACQSSGNTETTDTSQSEETVETIQELTGIWTSTQKVGNTSIDLTYTFNKDETYKEVTVADGLEQTVEGNYDLTDTDLILTPTKVDGVDEEEYVAEHGIDENTRNDPDYIFKPIETSIDFGDNDTLTLTVGGSSITFNKEK